MASKEDRPEGSHVLDGWLFVTRQIPADLLPRFKRTAANQSNRIHVAKLAESGAPYLNAQGLPRRVRDGHVAVQIIDTTGNLTTGQLETITNRAQGYQKASATQRRHHERRQRGE